MFNFTMQGLTSWHHLHIMVLKASPLRLSFMVVNMLGTRHSHMRLRVARILAIRQPAIHPPFTRRPQVNMLLTLPPDMLHLAASPSATHHPTTHLNRRIPFHFHYLRPTHLTLRIRAPLPTRCSLHLMDHRLLILCQQMLPCSNSRLRPVSIL